jgi:hypothetical protein
VGEGGRIACIISFATDSALEMRVEGQQEQEQEALLERTVLMHN